MTDPWADYLISHVRYEDAQIVKVLAWEDRGATITAGRQLARDQVLELLRQGSTLLTINRVAERAGQWRPEAIVRLVRVDGSEYIRTDAVTGQRDHLGQLSEF